MKKEFVLCLMFVLALPFVVSEDCNPDVTLLNQDPYPSVPGDYVKLVFQVENLDNPECGGLTFELLEDYPIKLNPGESSVKTFSEVSYLKDYESNILIPYEVRIDEEALDGKNPIEVRYSWGVPLQELETFDLEVDDVRADFEIYISEYDVTSNTLTFEILNIEESDVEALTIEIPKQDGIIVKGSPKAVAGDLDSDEYTTIDFEATPSDGEITVYLEYSDATNIRRGISKTVLFESEYFTDRAGEQKSTSPWAYAFLIAVLWIIVGWFLRRRKAKKQRMK